MKLSEKIFILFIALVYLLGQLGCATGRYEYPTPEPLPETYRELLGTIGVVKGPDVPVIEIETPPTFPTSTGPGVLVRMGRGTVEGAENSWDWWLDLCGKPFERKMVEKRVVGVVIYSLGLYLLPVIAVGVCYIVSPLVPIFGGLGGFFYGALPPDEPLAYPAADEVTLRYTVANYPIQETFQSSFLKEARARTSHTFLVGPEHEPQTDEGMVGPGVDTILELSVQRIWLKRVGNQEPELNPPMVLVLYVRARLVRGTEKTVWYDQTFVHETKKRPYRE
ncbi:MAG: hypothetical protein OEV70_13380, partial [Nitrospirota bacterium]|nr:hypothetical protein [Nitrospirota bacterium]